jgi:hypothetical protein
MTALIYTIKDLSFDGKLQSRPPADAALSPKKEDEVLPNVVQIQYLYCAKGGAYTIHARHRTFCIGKMQHVVGVSLS